MLPAKIREALALRDHRSIEHLLATERPALDELRALLAADEPALVHTALLHVKRRLARLEGGDTPAGLIDALPRVLHACAPETRLLLADIAILLPPELPASRLASLGAPPADIAEPVDVAIAWLRVEALREPLAFGARPPGELVRQAAARATPVDALDLDTLLGVLCASPDASVQRAGAAHLASAVDLGLLPLPAIVERLIGLLDSPHPGVVSLAATTLAEPWAIDPVLPNAGPGLRALLTEAEPAAIAALRALAPRSGASLLRLALVDERLAPSIRREAMRLLGPYAGHEDLGEGLLVARADPLFFGVECASLLLILYRRGVRCEPAQVPPVCEIYLENHDVEPDVIAEVLSQRQGELAAAIQALSLADPRLARHLALLRASDTKEARGLLRELLGRDDARAAWGEIVEALGHLRCVEAEAEVLSRFEAAPWSSIEALRQIGGERTLVFFRAHPAVGAADDYAAWGDAARDLLFQLEDDPARSLSLLATREPTPAALACLHSSLGARELLALDRIAREAAHPLRLQAITELGRAANPGATAPLGAALIDPDELVRARAYAALRALGAELFRRGRARPACLLDAHDETEAGELVLTETLLDQLARPSSSDAQLERLLEQLVDRKHRALALRVRRFLRHPRIGVQKLALECLAGCGDPRAIAWLVPLAGAEDIQRLRQALRGLGNFAVAWAAPALVKGLAHPDMNIKKTAAEALARTGPGGFSIIPTLVRWLGTHDNPGFRVALGAALRRAAGRGTTAVLMTALGEAQSDRERLLLSQALSGALAPAAIAALARRDAPAARILLGALYGKEVSLGGGALADLDAALRRRGLEREIPDEHPDRAQNKLLRAHRFDEDLDRLGDLLSASGATTESSQRELARLLGELTPMGLSEARADVLSRHADALERLIEHPQRALREAALSAVSAVADRLSAFERSSLVARVRRARTGGLVDAEGALSCIHRCGGVPSAEEARLAFALPGEALRRWGVEHLATSGELDAETSLRLLAQERSRDVRALVLAHALRAGWHARVLDAALEASSPELLSLLQASWSDQLPEAELLERLVLAAERAPGSLTLEIVRWIARRSTDASRAALRRLARGRSAEVAGEAVSALGRPVSTEDRALLLELLAHDQRDLRRLAAAGLARRREPERRPEVLARFLDVRLGAGAPAIDLDLDETRRIGASLTADADAEEGELHRERAAELLARPARLPVVEGARLTALLRVWEQGGLRSAPRARAALHAVSAGTLLPFILPALREGQTAVLEVLGVSRWLSPQLFSLFREASEHGRTHFLGLFLR